MGKHVIEMTAAERELVVAEMRANLVGLEREAALALERRRAEAWALARATARTLRQQFGATRVVLFGSLARGHFTPWSDVDILAYGIPESLRLAAMADLSVERHRPGVLALDVLAAEEMSGAFIEAAEAEGVEIHGD